MSLRMVAHLALIALGLYFAVDAGMTVVAHVLTPEAAVVAPRRADTSRPERAKAQVPGSRIVERNLFGEAALVVPAKPVAEPVKREIGLDLVGTIVADGDQGVAAIIFDRASKAQDFFRVGQAVRPGVTLKSVQRKSAVLGSAQGDVLLTMGDEQGGAPPAQEPPSEAGTASGFALSRGTLEESMQNLGQVMQQAHIEKVSRGGTNGYRITSIQNGSVFDRLNLQNGDIVTGINGQEITDPGQFTEFYNSLPQHDSITVNLYRRGRKHDLTFSLQ